MRKKISVLFVAAIAIALLLTACTVEVTLDFVVDGEVYASVETTGKEAIQMPQDPAKEGYIFDGWYWDKDVWEQPFTVNSLLEMPLSTNMTVYAKWEEAPHVHTYGDWTVVTPATCTAEGQKKRVCSCGTEETEVIPKSEHNYVTKHDATNHWEECSVCQDKINVTAHSFGAWEVITPATCTAAGEKKHVCTVCNAEGTAAIPKSEHTYVTKHDATNHWQECSVGHEIINVTAHTFGEWTVVTPATCTEEGLQKHVCSCGAEETESIPKSEHTYVTKHDATNHWQECSVGHEKINVTAHSFGAWEVITPATCTAAGEKKHVCTVCNAEGTAAIPKSEHTYETKHDATNHWEECSVGHEKINVTAHTFGQWTVVTQATCTAEGLQKCVCACGAEETEAIQKLEHSYGAWTVVTPATCTAEGLQKRTCSVCGIEETAVIEKLAHTYETKHDATNHWEECSVCQDKINVTAHTYGDWTVVTAATCTAEGQKKHTCTVCRLEETAVIMVVAHTYATQYDDDNHWKECSVCHEKINVTAHTFGDWTVVTPATCTAEGQKKHTCTVCRLEETAVITVVAHTYATQYDDNNHWKECSVCGDVKETEAHTYVNDVCTVCGRVYGTQGLAYTRITNGYSISGIGTAASNAKIEIPSRYEGEPVTEIGNYAFENCGFTAIEIPNSVTSIGNGAFYGCDVLTSVTISNGVTSIGNGAFFGCGSLTNIAIPQSVTSIDELAFYGCSGLETITVAEGNTKYRSVGNCLIETAAKTLIAGSNRSVIPTDGSVTSIGSSAFSERDKITSIVIPQSVTSVGYNAFGGCIGLTELTIPAAVAGAHGALNVKNVILTGDGTSIGDYAFRDCGELRSIAIPDSVTSIGFGAFQGCASLQSIALPEGVTSIGYHAFNGCNSLTSIAIPNGVTKIDYYTFLECGSLTNIVIPQSVTSIGNYAFEGCRSLTSVVIPQSVTSIGVQVFRGCGGLEAITVAEGNTKYHSAGNCLIETAAKTLIAGCNRSVIPTDGSVTSIGSSAFQGCGSLQSIVIPNGVTSIGNSAFAECGSLQSVEIANSVTNIAAAAFADCGSLQSVEISNGVTSIGSSAFQGCGKLTSIVIPQSVTSIGDSAFRRCGSLQSIAIPAGVTSIDKNTFYQCGSLANVEIPNGVTTIGNNAFFGCGSLTSIEIPDSVTSIGFSAFQDCGNLKSIAIPQSVTSVGSGAFNGCISLESITVSEGNTKYHSAGNCLIETAAKTLIAGCKNSVIPTDGSVTSVGRSAFSGCAGLQSIVIPDSVTGIGDYAFYDCGSLTSIAIPNSVTSIDYEAFYKCSSLTSIEYQGTTTGWKAIMKGSEWNYNTGEYTVTCTDGTLSKAEA